MGKKLLIQFMIVWGICLSAHAREQQTSDTSTVVKTNRLNDRLINGDTDKAAGKALLHSKKHINTYEVIWWK